MTARRWVVTGFAALIVASAAAGSARAQDRAQDDEERPRLGETRQLVISLERAIGFTYGSTVADARENAPRLDESGTSWGPLGAPTNAPRFAVPRLALDGFLGRRFSVGGAFGYARRSSDSNVASRGNTAPTKNTADALALAARIGYLAPLTRAVSIWPRVGFTYLRTRRTAPAIEFSSNSLTETFGFHALTLEAPIVLRIVDHVVATAGPTLDLGLAGSTETRLEAGPLLPSRRAREIDVGLNLGLGGYF